MPPRSGTVFRIVLLVARFILMLPAALCAADKEVRIAPPPAWVEAVPVPTDVKAPSSSVGEHYLLIESQADVASGATYRHHAYRILDSAGLRHGSQVSVSFDPAYETLALHHVRLIRNGEILDRLDRNKLQVIQRETDLEYLLYSGSLTALLILDDVRVGDIVDLAFTKTGTNPVFGDRYIDTFGLDWSTPVAHLRRRIVHPADRKIAHRVVGSGAPALQERRSEFGRELIWQAHDLPEIVYDRNIPSWHDSSAWVELSDYATWGEVVAWGLPLYAVEADASAVKERATALAAGARSQAERALRALDFVQKEIRYLGIETGAGSHRPSSPSAVLARRFGDCKDKAYLLVSLFREMGMDAAPVLVHTSRRQAIKNALPSPLAFNHVIVRLRLDGTDYVLDPTLVDQRGGLPLRHIGRYRCGLVIAPGESALTHWPLAPGDESRSVVEETFTVPGLQAPAKLHVRTTYFARSAERTRSYLKNTSPDDLKKNYVDFYARYFPDVATEKPVAWRDDEAANTIVVDEYYTVPNLFRPQATETFLKAEFSASAISEYTGSPGATDRKAPLAVAHPVNITHTFRVLLHEPWSVKPQKVEVIDQAFAYERTSSSRDREVNWTYRWTSKADHVPKEATGAHSRNLARVNDDLGFQLTYDTAAQHPTFSLNWGMLALAGLTLSGAAYGSARLWRLQQPAIPPPLESAYPANAALTGLGGWLILVGIGLVLRPIRTAISLFPTWSTYIDLNTWRILTDADHAAYQPAYAVVAPVEMVGNLVLLIAPLVLLGLFFAKRRIFPKAMIAFLVFECATSVFGVVTSYVLTSMTEADRMEAYGNFARGLLVMAIWIPYFCVSRRVKLTFTR